MVNFLGTVNELLDFIDDIAKKACVFLGILMAGTVILQVLCRYVLKNPLIWTEELSRYLMIWLGFIGASTMVKNWENVYVDYFVKKLPSKVEKAIVLVNKTIILIFLIWMLNLSMTVYPKVSLHQVTPALGISMLWPQFGIVAGIFLMAVQLIGVIINTIFEDKVTTNHDNEVKI